MRCICTSIIVGIVTASCLVPVTADARIWIGFSGDPSWGNLSNWNNNFSPGVDDFAFWDISADGIVFLSGNQSSASLRFGDTVPSHNWIVSPGTVPDSTMKLEASGSLPLVDVVNQAAIFRVPIVGNQGLTKIGFGTLVLARPNTYMGQTSVRTGAVALDFSDLGPAASNIIPASSELHLGALGAAAGGGTLELIGATGAMNSEAFESTTIKFGQNALQVDQNGATNVDLFLGAFDRDVGSVLNLTLPTMGDIRAQSATVPNTHGILGAWATVGSGATATWAANDSAGKIVPYSAFTEISGAPMIANAPASNLRWSGSNGDATLAAGTTDINTFLFSDSARRSILIPNGSTLRVGMSGGFFKTDNTAGDADSLLTIGSPGTFLTAGGGPNLIGELILNTNSSAPDQNGIVINSTITNNGPAPVTVIKSGNASTLFTASNTYTDGTYITSGRLQTSAAGGFGTGPVYVATGAQAYLDAGTHSNDFFISGKGLAESSQGATGGALRLAGNGVTVTGKVTLLGDAQIDAGGAVGDGAIISGQITGPANVEFNSTSNGILTLTNSMNNWTGNMTIGPGVLRLGGNGMVIPLGSKGVIMHGDPASSVASVLDLNGKFVTVRGLSSTGDSTKIFVRNGATAPATLRIRIERDRPAHFGGVIEDGAGPVGVTLDDSGVLTLSGANTYSGPTVLEGGTIQLGSSAALSTNTRLVLTRGWLDLAGFNATVSNLSGGGSIANTSAVTPSMLTVAGGTNVFGGSLVNWGLQPLGLTVSGGTLTLDGAHSYTGPTTLNGGALVVNTWLEPTGTVIVNSGGTLGGAPHLPTAPYGRIGHVTMQPGSNFRPGTVSDGSIATLTLSSLTVNGGDFRFDLSSNGTSDRVNVVGAATFNAPSTITPARVVAGTYTLLTADTLRGTPPTLNVPTGARATFALSFETLADQIRLIITGSPPKTLTWTGANGSDWDLNTTANWTDGTVPEKFFNLDSVTFGDGPNRNISVNTTVVPASVTFNNSAGNDYTIAGTGSIGDGSFTGTTLRKSGAGTLTIGGSTTYNAPITITGGVLRTTGDIAVNNSVIVQAPGANFAVEGQATVGDVQGAGRTIVGAPGATLTTNFIRQASLTVDRGNRVTLRTGGGTSVVGELLVPTGGPAIPGTLDINNNPVIVNYADAASNPQSEIRARIIEGRGTVGLGATWTGPGITSGTAATAVLLEPESRSVGYADNATLPLGRYTNFRGQPVDDTSILMAFTRTGDANLDGLVNDDDVTIVGAFYAPGVPQPSWALGDFDYNGFVDDDDVTLLGVFYNPSAPPLAATLPGTAAVPEPESIMLALLAAAGICLNVLRRRMRL